MQGDPAGGEGFFFGAIGEESEVSNADKGFRDYVEEESSDKFIGGKSNGFVLIAITSIFIVKGNFSVIVFDDSVIGDGHTMGVAAKVIEDLIWTRE